MPLITTNTAAPDLPLAQRQQAYNCLDTCITAEIHYALQAKLAASPGAQLVYDFERSMQGPAFTMALRGIPVDEVEAQRQVEDLLKAEAQVIYNVRQLAAVWQGPTAIADSSPDEILKGLRRDKLPKGFNPHSPTQVKALLFGPLEAPEPSAEQGCGEKPYKAKRKAPSNSGTAQAADTANEEALLMLEARSPRIGIMCHLILRARELRKARGFVAAQRSPDGRLRSSFNVGATTSGRWSFSKNCFGEGLNFGNIPKDRRSIFVASSPGRLLANADLKQAESCINAYLCQDENYINDHETGDPHTRIALAIYGNLCPPTEDPKAWVKVPNAVIPKGKSPRQLCKGLAHGCLTGDHEVLTRDGWVPIATARSSGVEIWIDGKGWEYPSDWYDTIAQDGELLTFEGQSYSQRVTNDHRMLTHRGDARADALTKSDRLRKTALPWIGGKSDEIMVRLSAALWADGSQQGNRTRFHFRKKRKIERLLWLARVAALKPHIRVEQDGTTSIEFHGFPIVKKAAGAWLLEYDIETVLAYLDETCLWDCWCGDSKTQIATTDAAHAEWLQTLCYTAGISSQRRSIERDESRKTIWRVTMNSRKWARVSSMRTGRESAAGKRILCPVTSTGAFLVRRQGHISVSGNTPYGVGERKSSKMTGVAIRDIVAFREGFFGRYPGVLARITGMSKRLATDPDFVSVMGRPHRHMGHPADDETVRAALADEPQGVVADILNIVLWRLWIRHDIGRQHPRMWLLSQAYDSVLFEFRREDLEAVREAVARAFEVHVPINGNDVVVGHDFGYGRTWKEACS